LRNGAVQCKLKVYIFVQRLVTRDNDAFQTLTTAQTQALCTIGMNLKDGIRRIDWKYIIIEISIIVIGILIALQVDNWKTERNTRLKEIAVLRELNSELLSDLTSISVATKRCDGAIKDLGILQMHLYRKQPYVDSLQDHAFKIVYQIIFEHKNSAFDNLKTNGIDLVSNESLRLLILGLYEYNYPRHLKIIDIETNIEKYRDYYDNNRILIYSLNSARTGLGIDEQIDPRIFAKSEFLDIVTTKMASFIIIKRHLETLEKDIRSLVEIISKETIDR
jgi:hypothetical protein